MIFETNKAYTMDLSIMPRWQPIFSVPELSNMFKDGRVFGKLAEHILTMEFDNLSLAPEGGPFDLRGTEGETIEVKSITKGGFDTSPSAMLGAGRSYSADGHAARIHSIAENGGYYILADNRQLPVIAFYPVAATEELIFVNRNNNETGKRTSNQADMFINALFCPTIENESQLTFVDI